MANQNSENPRDLQQHIEKNRIGDGQLQQNPGQPPVQDDSDDLTPALQDNPEQVENVEGRETFGTREPDDDPEEDTGEEDPGAGIDSLDDDERAPPYTGTETAE